MWVTVTATGNSARQGTLCFAVVVAAHLVWACYLAATCPQLLYGLHLGPWLAVGCSTDMNLLISHPTLSCLHVVALLAQCVNGL
jgi:hypothetical protein